MLVYCINLHPIQWTKNDNNKRALFIKTLKLTHAIMLFSFVDLKEILELSFILKKIKFRAAMRAAIELYSMTSHHPFRFLN